MVIKKRKRKKERERGLYEARGDEGERTVVIEL
jgi:hypothetical protein